MPTVTTVNYIFYKGDSIELEFTLYRDKCSHELWNLTDNQIRFQLHNDAHGINIRKATANVSGGGDDQIYIEDAIHGKFIVFITKEETVNLPPADYQFEIQVTTVDEKRFTVTQDTLRIVKDLINWEDE
jgi:hypothetical protein